MHSMCQNHWILHTNCLSVIWQCARTRTKLLCNNVVVTKISSMLTYAIKVNLFNMWIFNMRVHRRMSLQGEQQCVCERCTMHEVLNAMNNYSTIYALLAMIFHFQNPHCLHAIISIPSRRWDTSIFELWLWKLFKAFLTLSFNWRLFWEEEKFWASSNFYIREEFFDHALVH
jgi:hypothetical protein